MTAWNAVHRQMTSGDTRAVDVARSITVTGTRAVTSADHPRVETLFGEHLGPFARDDAHFYLGGAAGIDTLALQWLARRTAASFTVVVPCHLRQQPPEAVEEVGRWRESGRLTAVVELGAARLDTAAYHARNRWMVDRSRLVVAFPRDLAAAGGTWFTTEYGRQRGLGVHIAPPLTAP